MGNSKSQKYFGNRHGPSIDKELKHASNGQLMPTPSTPWMDTLTSQLEEPLGAAVTLAALLSASEELMKDYATPHFVDKVGGKTTLCKPHWKKTTNDFHSNNSYIF